MKYQAKERPPSLNIEKINLLNHETSPADLKIQFRINISSLSKPIEEYYKDILYSHYVYFYIVPDSLLQDVSRGLNAGNRKSFIRMVEHAGYNNIRKAQCEHTKISLHDLINSNKVEKKYSNGNYDCSFQIEARYKNSSFESPSQREGLSIFCFIENSEYTSTSSLKQNIAYEQVLKVNARKLFFIPRTREAYIVDESRGGFVKGEPYQGPVMMDSSMHPRAKLSGRRYMGPKLKTIQVRNTKTVSKEALNRVQKFQINIPGMQLLSIAKAGQSTESVYNPRISQMHTTSPVRRNEVAQNALIAAIREESSFLTEETKDTAYYRIHSENREDILDSSYCGCVISIDLYRFLLAKSNFSPVIDFHRRSKNYSVIKDIVDMSRIIDLKIYRKRLSNNEESRTKLGTKKRGKYSDSDPEKLIIETSENVQKFINHQINSLAEIKQVQLSGPNNLSVKSSIISLSLKDYDLFHNQDFGVYTYSVEVTVDDGTLKYIRKIYQNINKSLNQFSNYVQNISAAQGQNTQARNMNMKVVSEAVNNFEKASIFFSGARPNLGALQSQLVSPTVDMSLLEGFVKTLKNTQLTIEKYMKSTMPLGQSFDTPAEKSQNQSTGALPGAIYAKEDTGILHDIGELMGVCADPISTEQNMEENLLYESIMGLLKITKAQSNPDDRRIYHPNRFVEIEKSRYKAEDNTSYAIAASRTNNLKNLTLSKHVGVKKENFPPGKVSVLETLEGYQSSTEERKRQVDIKIGSYIKCESDSFMLRGKPEEFYEKFLTSNLSGITISAAKFSSTSIPASAEQVLRDAIVDMMPDATETLKKSIIESAYKSKNEKDFEKNLSNNYKELISIRKSLGTAYKSFSSYLAFQSIATDSKNSINYEEEYKSGAQLSSNSSEEVLVESPFVSETFSAYAVIPGRGKFPIESMDLSSDLGNGMLFVKFENSKQKKVPLINNGILLRLS